MNGGTFDYSRGKGLGGSSVVNFGVFTVGPKDDYDEFARLVGDDFFDWKHAQERIKKFESYKYPSDPAVLKYTDPSRESHGHDGPVKIEFPALEDDVAATMDAFLAGGLKLNKDMNSGDPIGASMCPITTSGVYRTTAAKAYLTNPPNNLNIVTDAQVTKIVFDNKRATGVVANGQTCE